MLGIHAQLPTFDRMTASHPVPADAEADSLAALLCDCREVSGVLGSFSPAVVRLPEPRSDADLTITISPLVAAGLDGYDEYGS